MADPRPVEAPILGYNITTSWSVHTSRNGGQGHNNNKKTVYNCTIMDEYLWLNVLEGLGHNIPRIQPRIFTDCSEDSVKDITKTKDYVKNANLLKEWNNIGFIGG